MKSIQKVLFVLESLAGGGAERVGSILSNSLVDLGYKVDVILYSVNDIEYDISSKVYIHRLPKNQKNQMPIVYKLSKFLHLRRLIARIQPDVIIPFMTTHAIHCFWTTVGLKIPLVVAVRNNPQLFITSIISRLHYKWVARYSSGVFLQTERNESFFSSATRKKCFIVPNPISLSILNTAYDYRKHIRKLVTMGRLAEQKNQRLLIEAFAKVHKVVPKLTLDIYGEGPLQDELSNLIITLELEKSVKLCGRTNNAAQTLAQYDLFIISSDYEGMPNALMEAMGIGLPCISTDCPTGPAELIGDNERGLLSRVRDVSDLCEKIIYACNENDIMKSRGQSARKYVAEMFAPGKIAKKLIDELEKLLNRQELND